MTTKKKDDIATQAMDLWKKTVAQLDEISKALMKSSGLDKLKLDRVRLLEERDKLLKRLGEETYKLIDKNKIKVPDSLKKLYERISNFTDKLVGTKKSKKKTTRKKKSTGKKKSTKKKSTRKKPSRKKKTTKRKKRKVVKKKKPAGQSQA